MSNKEAEKEEMNDETHQLEDKDQDEENQNYEDYQEE